MSTKKFCYQNKRNGNGITKKKRTKIRRQRVKKRRKKFSFEISFQ